MIKSNFTGLKSLKENSSTHRKSPQEDLQNLILCIKNQNAIE